MVVVVNMYFRAVSIITVRLAIRVTDISGSGVPTAASHYAARTTGMPLIIPKSPSSE